MKNILSRVMVYKIDKCPWNEMIDVGLSSYEANISLRQT